MVEEKKEDKGEEEIIKIRNSRKVYLPVYVMILILLGFIVYIKINDLPLNRTALIGVIVFVILGIKFAEVHRLFHSYELTPGYVVHTFGYVSRDMTRIFIPTISDLILKQNGWQRLLNYGNIEVHRYSDGSAIDLRNIPNPSKLLKILENRLSESHKRMSV
ncbi:MAG: PH domain-containing protein [Candidatus Pacearchaeota archaeon]